MPDFDAIAGAIAARYAGAVTTPAAPAGETDIRESTANIPNALGPLPAVLVFTDRGGFEQGNQTRIGTADFLIRFYLELGVDLARDETRLRKWLTVLVDRLKVSTTLGGLVARVYVAEWQLAALTFERDEYSGIQLRARAVTAEAWAAS